METFPPILKNKWKRFHLSSLYYLLFVLSTLFRKKFTQAKKYMEFSIILLILYSNLGTVACAWHRQVRLASLAAAKHTPRKRQQEQHGKPGKHGSRKRFAKQRFFGKRRRNGAKRAGCESKPPKSEVYGDEKARRRGAVPADPLWGSAAAFSAAHGFLFIGFRRSLHLLNLLFRSAMVA